VKWGSAAAAAITNQAAVDSLLEAEPDQRILTLRGGSQDLILASVDGHILALFMPGSSSVLRLALAVEEILHRLPSLLMSSQKCRSMQRLRARWFHRLT
jgi:hypothetical protein